MKATSFILKKKKKTRNKTHQTNKTHEKQKTVKAISSENTVLLKIFHLSDINTLKTTLNQLLHQLDVYISEYVKRVQLGNSNEKHKVRSPWKTTSWSEKIYKKY